MQFGLVLLISVLVVVVNSESNADCDSTRAIYTPKTDRKFVIEAIKVIGGNLTSSEKRQAIKKSKKNKKTRSRAVKDSEISDDGEDSEDSRPAEYNEYVSFIGIPYEVAKEVFGVESGQSIYAACSCHLKVGFKISGEWFWMTHENLIVKNMPRRDGLCYTNLLSCPTNEYTIGKQFSANNCVLNDREGEIGFSARSISNKSSRSSNKRSHRKFG